MSRRAGDLITQLSSEYLQRLESERAVLESAIGSQASKFVEEEEQKLEQEELQLLQQLREAEAEYENAEHELQQIKAQQAQLAADEESFWQEQLVTLLQAASAQDEEQALRQQTEAANAHLAVLRRSHVLNDCFHIMPGDSASSPFSTINGFKIDWQEVNTAWGQAAMLLTAAAALCGCTFKPYKVLPLGSFSRIVNESDESMTLELFYRADSSMLQRMRGGSNFDRGMVAFMQCVQQLQEHIISKSSTSGRRQFIPPYAIHGDQIEDMAGVCMKRDSSDWDKATRYLLINLKYIILETANLKKDKVEGGAAASDTASTASLGP